MTIEMCHRRDIQVVPRLMSNRDSILSMIGIRRAMPYGPCTPASGTAIAVSLTRIDVLVGGPPVHALGSRLIMGGVKSEEVKSC